VGPKRWSGPFPQAFQNAKRLLVAAVPLPHPAPNAELSESLTPSTPTSEGSCNKNQETIGDHLVSFPANSLTQNPIILLFIANYELPMQQSNISAIYAKVKLFNSGQITNLLLMPFPVFQPPISPRQQRHFAFIADFKCTTVVLT
jgi:hypothetical protein